MCPSYKHRKLPKGMHATKALPVCPKHGRYESLTLVHNPWWAMHECRSLGAAWRGLQIPFGIDNMAFQKSSAKGRSKAPRLNSLLRELFVLQIEHNFILCPYWLSTHENTLADDLSRNRAGKFLRDVRGSGFLTSPSVHLQQADDAGRTVAVSAFLEPGMHALRQLLDSYSSNVSKDGPPAARGLSAQTMSVAYPPTSIWDGLPFDVEGRVEEIMDNHLAPSSREKMMVGYRRWAAYCEARAWPTLLKTGDSSRGGKLAAWVTSMVDETELVYASISTYVWGVRSWMVLQHQADPILGCLRLLGGGRPLHACILLNHFKAHPKYPMPIRATQQLEITHGPMLSLVKIMPTIPRLWTGALRARKSKK